jgi:hypothetical protein
MTLLDSMPHTANVFNHTYSTAGSVLGGRRRIEVNNVTGIAVWMQNASQGEIQEHAKRDMVITHKMYYTPGDVDFKVGDTVLITDGPSEVGLRFEHKSNADRSAGLGCLRIAMVEEINNLQSGIDEL